MSMPNPIPIEVSTPVRLLPTVNPTHTTIMPMSHVPTRATRSPSSILSEVPSYNLSSKAPTLSESSSSVPVNQVPMPTAFKITQMPLTNTPVFPLPTILPTRNLVPVVEVSFTPSQMLVPLKFKTVSPSIEASIESSSMPSKATPVSMSPSKAPNTSSPSIQLVNDDDASNDSPALIIFPTSMPTMSTLKDTTRPSLQDPGSLTLAPVSPVALPISNVTVMPSTIPIQIDSTSPSRFHVPMTAKTQSPTSKPIRKSSLRPSQNAPMPMPIVARPFEAEETPSYVNDDDTSNDSPAFVEFPSSLPRDAHIK
jgi:hypothetical protein